MAKQKITYIELLGKWAGYKAGDVIRCGGTKGAMLIGKGLGKEVKKPVKVETAMAPPPAENAMASPVVGAKTVPEEVKDEKKDAKPGKKK